MSDNKFEVKPEVLDEKIRAAKERDNARPNPAKPPHVVKDGTSVVVQVIVYDNEGKRHVAGVASISRQSIDGTLVTELPQEIGDAFSNGPREILICPKDRFKVPRPGKSAFEHDCVNDK